MFRAKRGEVRITMEHEREPEERRFEVNGTSLFAHRLGHLKVEERNFKMSVFPNSKEFTTENIFPILGDNHKYSRNESIFGLSTNYLEHDRI